MERNKCKVVVVIEENKNPTDIMDFEQFFNCIKTKNIETIIIGEFDPKTDSVIFEKQYSAVAVMPSTFGKDGK